MNSMITHHAVLISAPQPLSFICDEEAFVVSEEYRLEQLKIDDVRALIQAANRRPSGDVETQTLLVATEFITEEAQQALLKIIEEPPLSTKFVFVLKDGYTLLPTLESRFVRVESSTVVPSDVSVFRAFKEAPVASRLEQIERSVKTKDHEWQSDIKRGLAAYVLAHRFEIPFATLTELDYVLRLLLTRGASNKLLLEHLALTLPA